MIKSCLSTYILLFVFMPFSSFSQNNKDSIENVVMDIEFSKKDFKHRVIGFMDAWESLLEGNRCFNNKDYSKALENYQSAEAYNCNYLQIKKIIGICYFLMNEFEKSSKVFKVVLENINNPELTVLYYLGCVYQVELNYDKALYVFNLLIKDVEYDKLLEYGLYPADRFVECQFAKTKMLEQKEIDVHNLTVINTVNSEYCPVFSQTDSILYFTRFTTDFHLTNSNESIYRWKENSKNIEIFKINDSISSNHSLSYYSQDGSLRLFTVCGDKNCYGSCDIFYSNFIDGQWSDIKNFGKTINSRKWEVNGCISGDRKSFYFLKMNGQTANIYYSTKDFDDKWDKPEQLEFPGSSEYDIYSIFLHADGINLFFCSRGKNSFGGIDIYRITRLSKKKWSVPENMGSGINTPANENGVWISPDNSYGFFCSDRIGTKGEYDIYKFVLKK